MARASERPSRHLARTLLVGCEFGFLTYTATTLSRLAPMELENGRVVIKI